jgi:hypothetical protein
MEKKLILRGLLSGLIAGLLAFAFARLLAEPQIAKAVDYESGRDAAQAALDRAAGLPADAAGPDIFSRTVQGNVGIGVGIVAFAVALGGLYAVAYSIAYGRVGAVPARALALLVALGAFLTVYLVPFLKYPANPPAIGDPDTIRERGALYLCLVAGSVILGVLCVVLGRRLRAHYSGWTATLLAAAAFVVVVGILIAFLPSFGSLSVGSPSTDIPQPLTAPDGRIVYPGFPADVLFRFRLYSLGVQVILWGTIGLVFGPLAQRLLEPAARRTRAGTSLPEPAARVAS